MARVILANAFGFTRDGGAPTLTSACTSASAFRHEVTRLAKELEALGERGCAELEGQESRPAPAAAAPGSAKAAAGGDHLDTSLRVSDVMTREVKTLHRNDRISMADELMKVGHFRHVVVLDEDERVAGIVSHRDIFYGALAWTVGQGRTAHDRTLEATPVKDVMQSNVVGVGPDTSLADAAARMMEHKIGCLPVLEADRLVGILTEGDFLALIASR